MASKPESEKLNRLSIKLKKARSEAKLTQKAVAEKAGVHINFYARLERGEVDVSWEKLEDILHALGLTSIDIN
jgi:transcriptional regulator with XRE-family HTH domain